MLPVLAILVCVEPHDGVAPNAEIIHTVTQRPAMRVDLNLLLRRNRLGIVIQAEDCDARIQNY